MSVVAYVCITAVVLMIVAIKVIRAGTRSQYSISGAELEVLRRAAEDDEETEAQ